MARHPLNIYIVQLVLTKAIIEMYCLKLFINLRLVWYMAIVLEYLLSTEFISLTN